MPNDLTCVLEATFGHERTKDALAQLAALRLTPSPPTAFAAAALAKSREAEYALGTFIRKGTVC